ncbi:MAG: SIS domain-containing protein [Bryobacterales bacterium]|nr:SIS domain-containing protein [Bryobacterales bacterium]
MNAAFTYYERTLALLKELRDTQTEAIDRAAEICTNAIANNGLVFLFGNGHSRMMCEEMTPRQGCFVGWVAMVELAVSNHASIVGNNGLRTALHLEKYEGYAAEILKSFRFGPHDAMIIISTSGLRPLIVEMAMGAKERSLPVIGVVSRKHSEAASAGHSSGKKLIDLADVVIDNQCPPGDCVLELEGLEWRTGPTSTVTGAMIINMLRCEVAERLLQKGITPTLLPSHQFVGNTSAQEQLERFYDHYRRSLAHLYTD